VEQLAKISAKAGDGAAERAVRGVVSVLADAFAGALLGTVAVNPNSGTGTRTPRMWAKRSQRTRHVGAAAIWEFYDGTADAQPIHIHEVPSKLWIDRQSSSTRSTRHSK
jgi:hypothetical protein